jgi:peptidyl-prolyl cis-trans isomerase D
LETDFFSKDEKIPFVGGSDELIEEVFSLKSGEIAYPFLKNDTYYILKVLERKDSYIPSLNEVKGEIEKILTDRNKNEAAKQKAERLIKKLKEGNSLEEIANKEKLTIKETGFFSRSRAEIPKIGPSPKMKAIAFNLSLNDPYPEEVFKVNDKYYIIKLKKKEAVLKEEFKEKEKDYRKKYYFQKRERYLDAWLRNARMHAEVKLNLNLIKT